MHQTYAENLHQCPSSEESTYQFIIRCLEMKQKVYIVSKQSDEITYEPCATIIFENP